MSRAEMTIKQKRDLRTHSRRIRKTLDALLDLARSTGCAHPFLYFESEGGIYVLDNDHPCITHNSAIDRRSQPAIVFALPDLTPPGSDVGAW